MLGYAATTTSRHVCMADARKDTAPPSEADNRSLILFDRGDEVEVQAGEEGVPFLETVKHALDQTVRELELAEKQQTDARDKIWRENFCPHAIILTERTVTSPIFVAVLIGVEKLLRIDLDATQGPVSFVRQVLDRLPERVPAFGKPNGFVINYSPDQAVRFDSNWRPIAILDKAIRPVTAVLRLGGRAEA
jgi:hypothetical protein